MNCDGSDPNVLLELRRPKPNEKVVIFVAGKLLDRLFVSIVTFAEIRFGTESVADATRRTEIGSTHLLPTRSDHCRHPAASPAHGRHPRHGGISKRRGRWSLIPGTRPVNAEGPHRPQKPDLQYTCGPEEALT